MKNKIIQKIMLIMEGELLAFLIAQFKTVLYGTIQMATTFLPTAQIFITA